MNQAIALLERIALALEANTVTGTAAETPQPPTPAAPSAPGTPAPVPSASYDDMCEAINAYADRHGHQEAKKKLVAEFGATYFKAVKPEQYGAVVKAFAE